MASRYGWVHGSGRTITLGVDATGSAINEGDALKFGTNHNVTVITGASAGQIIGIAAESCATLPTSDGDKAIRVYIDTQDIFRYPAATGSNLSNSSLYVLCSRDMSAVQTVDEDATGNASNQVQIVGYNLDDDTVDVKINFTVAWPGLS
jgi:hypothetical protein